MVQVDTYIFSYLQFDELEHFNGEYITTANRGPPEVGVEVGEEEEEDMEPEGAEVHSYNIPYNQSR